MNVRGCAAPLEGRAVLCLLNCGLCLRVPGRQAAGKRCAPGLLRCPRHGSRCAIQSTWRSPISSLPGATCEDRETVRATLAPGSELIALREAPRRRRLRRCPGDRRQVGGSGARPSRPPQRMRPCGEVDGMPHSAACPAGVPEHRLPVIPETCPPGEGMSDSV